MTLLECINEANWKNTIKETWNYFNFNEKNQLDDTKTNDIYKLIILRINNLLPLDVIYDTIEEGNTKLCSYLKTLTINLVREFKSLEKSFNLELGKQHNQTAFTPIDNDDLEKIPIAQDDSSFTWYNNLRANAEYFYRNSKVLKAFYDIVRFDCIFVKGI